ncbi:MAG: zinc ribbon domain-containing protein [Candidatus Shapirobacteria bacterium]
MALINCPECKQQISDTAPTCPHCGFIQHATPVEGSGNLNQKTITIESTNKTWKLVMIVAILVFIIGGMVGASDREFGFSLVGLSVLIFIVAKIGAWWSNK